MNITTQTFKRRSYSGTEMANAIEHYKRRDIGGQIIVFIGCSALMALTYWLCWRAA